MKKRLITGFAAALIMGAMTCDARAAQADMLVTPQWLSAHLGDPDLVVLHVGDKGDYGAHHIPGARYVDLMDIAVERDGLSMQLPTAAELKQQLQALGISDRSRIVVYYGKDWISPATRVVFTLYAAGLGDRVSLLDGGMSRWQHHGGAISDKKVPAATGVLSDLHLQPVIVDANFVKGHMNAPGYDIIDARAQVYYDGVQAGGAMWHQRKGHIPGAKSIPFTSFTRDDLTQKTADETRAIFAAAGVKPGDHLIVYCHVGQQATAVLFAAREVGIDAVLYDGSFEDWSLHDGAVSSGEGR